MPRDAPPLRDAAIDSHSKRYDEKRVLDLALSNLKEALELYFEPPMRHDLPGSH